MPSDPRLNSMHLDSRRREEYRRARDGLLQACGTNTLGRAQTAEPLHRTSHTLVQRTEATTPPDVVCWLIDEDFIYPLRVGLNTVGRAPENDVVVRDGYVSRRHCAILVHSDHRCEVFDTASKNGTFVNGEKILASYTLRKGDQIRLCDCTLTFMNRLEEDQPPPSDERHTMTQI